jgi:hypothetical protein
MDYRKNFKGPLKLKEIFLFILKVPHSFPINVFSAIQLLGKSNLLR